MSQSENNSIKKIINDYNEAVNYFGKRADIDINQNEYNIPMQEKINIISDNEFDQLLN